MIMFMFMILLLNVSSMNKVLCYTIGDGWFHSK